MVIYKNVLRVRLVAPPHTNLYTLMRRLPRRSKKKKSIKPLELTERTRIIVGSSFCAKKTNIL